MRVLFAIVILMFPLAAQADEFGARFEDDAPVALDENRLWDIAPAAGDPRPAPVQTALEKTAAVETAAPQDTLADVVVIEHGEDSDLPTTSEETIELILE